MRSRTACPTRHSYKFAGDNTWTFDKPLHKYLIDFGEYVEIIEASEMTTTEHGVVFKNAIVFGKNGDRIGIGRTFLEHHGIIGVTMLEEEFGNITITNDTKLSLFSLTNEDTK